MLLLQAVIVHFKLAVVPLEVLETAHNLLALGKFVDGEHQVTTLCILDSCFIKLFHLHKIVFGLQELFLQFCSCRIIPLLCC